MRRLPTALLAILVASIVSAGSRAQEPIEPRKGLTVRVAAVSFVPQKFRLKENAERLAEAFRQAHKGGAELAVAPEGALDGYVVNEIIAGKVAALQMKDVAIPIDHPIMERFQNLASELNMCLVFGFAELIDGDVFNCAVFIDNRGDICGKYHKMQLAEGYHPSWWFNRLGRHSRAFETPFGRCGLMICNDRWNPELARIPTLDGARFLIIPAFGSRSEAQDKAVRSRARENNVPIVEANVGVTLIVDRGKITAVDRSEEAITFGEITVPPPIAANPQERDRVEQAFLAWREREMKVRYEKRLQQVKRAAEKAED